MIYTFFMKKFQKDKAPFPTTLLVKKYLKLYGQNDIVISFPGYMGTTSKSIGKFLSKMCFPTNTYFTVGMNGKNQMKLKSNVQDYHNSFFNKIKNINKPLKDHSKMLFFLDSSSVNRGLFNQNKEDVELEEAQSLLKGCKVKAVLIGSSNQSYNTYFKNPADKGEADVFMINADFFKETEKYGKPISGDNALQSGGKNKEDFEGKIIDLYEAIKENNDLIYNREKNLNQIILSKMLRGGEDDFLGEMLQSSLTKQ